MKSLALEMDQNNIETLLLARFASVTMDTSYRSTYVTV